MSARMTNPVMVVRGALEAMLGLSQGTDQVQLSRETRELVQLLLLVAWAEATNPGPDDVWEDAVRHEPTRADLDDDLVDDGHAVQRLRSGADGENLVRRHGNRHRGEPSARPATA